MERIGVHRGSLGRAGGAIGAAVALLCALIAATPAAAAEVGIAVTSVSDEVNGDVSSVERLLTSPGPDGVSLREALEATNNDPGSYAIGFAPELAGRAIAPRSDLPPLTGGGVLIEGDVDGDGRPDVTIRSTRTPLDSWCEDCGLWIASSGNQLHALTLEGFNIGVRIQPYQGPGDTSLPAHQTLADNAVNGLVIRGAGLAGIYIDSAGMGACGSPTRRPCLSFNRWVDTTLTDNEIDARVLGIGVALQNSVGDRVERLTVTDNTIRQGHAGNSLGVDLSAGSWIGSTRNLISDVLVARNSIEGGGSGVRVYSGEDGAHENVIEDIRIIDNRVRSVRQGSVFCCGGIIIGAADQATYVTKPNLRPIAYPNGNVLRNVEISGNTVSGTLVGGVGVQICCEGGSRNRIEDVRIERNVIRSTTPASGVTLYNGHAGSFKGTYMTGNRISGISIAENRIEIASRRRGLGNPRDAGGIVLLGGGGLTRAGVVRDIRITNNEIDTPLIGIHLVGGMYGGTRASVNHVQIEGNRILRAPTVASFRPQAKGISLTGGIQGARGNRVACITLAGNLVAGVRNDVSVLANADASGNVATVGGC